MEQPRSSGRQYQQTIKEELTISGSGIHTGKFVTLRLKPSPPNTGIVFQRVDLPGSPIVKADVDNVVETNRSTTLDANGARISTVEHLLAALVGMEVDNVLIELDGEEIPILDGSAFPFVEVLKKGGTITQSPEKIWYYIDKNVYYKDDEKNVEMVALPYKGYRLNTLIDFNSPVLGTQHASMHNISDFNEQIAPCRTFCFLHELELLLANNLIKGGDVNNAIVVVDRPIEEKELARIAKIFNKKEVHVNEEGILNNLKLRFPNEPARHKLLDMIGDLALVGVPFHAHIIANRPGHSSNVKFAKKLKESLKRYRPGGETTPVYDPNQPPLYDIQAIESILPHRYPFLLVDKVLEVTAKHVIAIKNVTYNEPFFQGHFPGNCVMPGVLLVEALAQTGGFIAIPQNSPDKFDTYFLKIESAKFKQKVVPGDTLILKMELMHPIRRGVCEMKGTIYVGDKIVTEAVLVAQVVIRPKANL